MTIRPRDVQTYGIRATAAQGYWVYAGARKEADLAALNMIAHVEAVRLDVTLPAQIDEVAKSISVSGRGLYGLVNNAGVGSASALLETAPAEFDLTMRVNVYGPYLVTKAVASLLLASKGRIVNIGSIRGILSDAYVGPYQMSKHALESFTDTLALELAPQGVQVSIVEPGTYHSDIEKNAARRDGQDESTGDRSMYPEPDAVAAAVNEALFDAQPKRRYLVVPNIDQAKTTIQAQLDQLVQLNRGQPYAFNRKTLVRMLDKAIARNRGVDPR